jgi:hypothetical protein
MKRNPDDPRRFVPSGELVEFIRDVVRAEVEDLQQAQVPQHDLGLSLEAFRKNVEAELGMILRVWAPANIRTYVQKKVEESAFELVMAALGLEHKWGKWEIASSGRGEPTEAMKLIMDAGRETIQEWFAQQMGDLPDLSKTVKDSIIREYKQNFERELRKRMQEEAITQARRKVERMVAEINGEPPSS